jgi:hypothetical protein
MEVMHKMDKVWISPKGEETLRKVANWLEAGAPILMHEKINGFNMCVAIEFNPDNPDCGSVCCIAGAVCQMVQPFDLNTCERSEKYAGGLASVSYYAPEGVFKTASTILDITEDDADELFCPAKLEGITAEYAAKVVHHFIETGKVDWEID